jgi:hypothetical protein
MVRRLLFLSFRKATHAAMQTLIDILELPPPAIERSRAPFQSLDLEVDYDDPDAVAQSSDRLLRARCWVSED